MISIDLRGFIKVNFFFAFWLSLAVAAFIVIVESTGNSVPSSDVMMDGLIYIVLSLIFWVAFFRHYENHLLAFIVGFTLLIPVMGGLISEQVNDVTFNRTQLYILGYVGVSYILFAWLEWKSWFGTRISKSDMGDF